jgi:hypothetical protein
MVKKRRLLGIVGICALGLAANFTFSSNAFASTTTETHSHHAPTTTQIQIHSHQTNVDNANKKAKKSIHGQAGILLEKSLTPEEYQELKKALGDVNKQNNGWFLTEDKIQRFYPANTGSVKIDNEEVNVNQDGTFTYTFEDDKEKTFSFNREDKKVEKNIKATGADEHVDLVKKMTFDEFFKKMDSQQTEAQTSTANAITINAIDLNDGQIDEDGEIGRPGAYVHCNRFNGPNGNNTYYSNEASSGAITNFYLSDCDRAFFAYNCVMDYTDSTNCKGLLYYGSTRNSNPRDCSTHLGHSIKFHEHRSY